jgi:beta-glucosidase/6-phospho-beta-glucosidase/beta-galactosidase
MASDSNTLFFYPLTPNENTTTKQQQQPPDHHTTSAAASGVKVTHYFAWCFMDNWEWKEGFQTKFGVVHVDFKNPALPRAVKDSGKWLAKWVFRPGTKQ